MRAVTGSVVSSQWISISRAASLLSLFASSDSGARQDVSAYLKRTSNAFDELDQFHREIKANRRRLRRESQAFGDGNENPAKAERNPRGGIYREIRENGEEERRGKVDLGVASDGNHKKKKRKDGEEMVEKRNLERKFEVLEVEQEGSDEMKREEKTHKKKKREKEEFVVGGGVQEEVVKVDQERSDERKRKKKKTKREDEEVGGDLDEEGTDMNRKKRKHFYAEEEAGGLDDRSEQRKKKKRRKEIE